MKNKATKAGCARLIRLCSGLDFFPKDEEVCDLLVTTLQRVAVDDQHAAAMVNHWLSKTRQAPTVSDLIRLSTEVSAAASKDLPDRCQQCRGDARAGRQEDWVLTDEGVRRCSCPRGQALLALDRTRYRESAKRPILI